METRKSSSADTVLGPEEVKAWEAARDELFIQIFQKRKRYFERWQDVTLKYFAAIDKRMEKAKNFHEDNIADVIKRYSNKIKERRDNFIASHSYEILDDDGTLQYLDGLDKLVKPADRPHRKSLIRKERVYRAKNQRLNPDTKIPQEYPASDDDTPPGNASQQAEDSSNENEQGPAAADWKSDAGSDTDS